MLVSSEGAECCCINSDNLGENTIVQKCSVKFYEKVNSGSLLSDIIPSICCADLRHL